MKKDFKDLAVRYFEGRLSPDKEAELFEFIAASPQNAASFRAWEQDWKQKHTPSVDVLRSFAMLSAKIERSEGRSRHRRLLFRFSAAAAVLILASLLVPYFSSQTPEQIFTVEAPLGTRSRVKLCDGTQIWLNAGSTMSYTSGFNTTSRNIRLSGEAYFEVAKNPKLPFCVEARGCTLTVLGTKFNVSAYDEDPIVQAALMEGALRFESDRDRKTMVPGDLVTYHFDSHIMSCEKADTRQSRDWIDGIIRYDAITLPALLRKLAREYAVSIKLCTTAFDEKTFRISLTKAQDIESILNGLCDILPIVVERDDLGYYVYSRH